MKNSERKYVRVRQHSGWCCVLAAMIVAMGTAQAYAQCEGEQRLIATGVRGGDHFGSSVSLSGETAIVGTDGDAYMFRFDGTTWAQEQKLPVSDAASSSFFGWSVSVSGATAVVGAWGDVCVDGIDCGSAYVFRFNGTTWVQEQKLTASDAAAENQFGSAVSVSGDTIVIGAHQDDRAGFLAGSAYVFRFNGTSWVEEQKLTAIDATPVDDFGVSVSVSGDSVMVGAMFRQCVDSRACGAVYMFRHNGTSWVQEQKLIASDARALGLFGQSVSLNGDTALVGANGSAYVFRFNGTAWVESQKLTPSDAPAFSLFGKAVSISDEVVVVGAAKDDCAAGEDCGSAYVFQFDGSAWGEVQKLTASFELSDSEFGNAVSVSEGTVLVGAFLRDIGPFGRDHGAAYMFDCQSTCGDGNLDFGEHCDRAVDCTECLCDSGFESTVPPSARCRPICGNGSLDPGEECDSGLGCKSCLCDIGFGPTVPPSVDCESTCNNGVLDPREECDGGMACTACRCAFGFESTVPPSFDCQSICGNGNLDPGEECDDGSACVECFCDSGYERTVPPSFDCRSICGNDRLDPEEECDGGMACADCVCDSGFEPTLPTSVDCRLPCADGDPHCLEEQKLIFSDVGFCDDFGDSVSVGAEMAAVGAPFDDSAACDTCGAAYMFRFNGTSWVEEQKLIASDADESAEFGSSVSVSADTVVIGAPFDDCAGLFSDCGAVYFFRFNGTAWVEEQKLIAHDTKEGDAFGFSVSVDGGTAVVGAVWDGSAYVFRKNGTTWVEEQKLDIPGSSFGASMSVSGETVVLGAPSDHCAAGVGCGAAYVFHFNGTTWVQQQKLTALDAEERDVFGISVSVCGDRVLVGASGDDCTADIHDNCGSAYVFRFNGTSWIEEQKLVASDSAKRNLFGDSVSISGGTAVVGASGNNCLEGDRCGSAYVFSFNGITWVEEHKLVAPDAKKFARFGDSVSLSGSTALVGAPSRCGAAYVFTGVLGRSVVTLDIKPSDCPNPVNPKSKGVVPVAIVGSFDFDVTTIDLDSLTLARVDGVGGGVTPLASRRGPRITFEDVATPSGGEPCDCHESVSDGLDDLSLKFSTSEMSRAFELNESPKGETIELVLRGRLEDGSTFEATDCIVIPGVKPTASELRRSRRSK